MSFFQQIITKIKKDNLGSWLEFLGLVAVIYMGKNISNLHTKIYFQGVLAGIGFMLVIFGKDIANRFSKNNLKEE